MKFLPHVRWFSNMTLMTNSNPAVTLTDPERKKTGRKPYFLVSESRNPYDNLAMERVLTENVSPGSPVLFLWQNDDTVVIGRNQDARAECRTDRMAAAGVRLMRRFSGGGAVWHDLGNINFSFCCSDDDYNVHRQTETVLSACRVLGINAVQTGRNDLEAEGCKFSGNAYYQVPGAHCQHGTLLVSCCMEKLGEYLTVSPEKLKKHAVASVRSRVINLSSINPSVTIPKVCGALHKAFESEYGTAENCFPADMDRVKAWADLLRSEEWIFGRKIPAAQTLRGNFPWGHVTLHLAVNKGIITDAQMTTDMLDSETPEKFISKLRGTACLPAPIAAAARAAGGKDFAAGIEQLVQQIR